jgi:hypothetical protein
MRVILLNPDLSLKGEPNTDGDGRGSESGPKGCGSSTMQGEDATNTAKTSKGRAETLLNK